MKQIKVVGDSGAFHRPSPLGRREDWRLEVYEGEKALGGRLLAELSLDALEALESTTLPLEIECVSATHIAGKGRVVPFGGTRFTTLLAAVYPSGVPEDLRTVKFISRAPAACGPKNIGHWTSLPLDACRQEENQIGLATKLDGEALPYQHGFPLRSIVGPRLFFYKSVKWLTAIEFVTTPIEDCRGTWEEYAGYHNLGWSEGKRFEPRMRVIERVVTENDQSWDESTLVPPESWWSILEPMLKNRDLSRLIVARMDEMGFELPKRYSGFRFVDGEFKAKLRGTRFNDCEFYGAEMAGCNFSLSAFARARFSREGKEAADLKGCDLEGAFFQKAALRKVSMEGATLTNTTFTTDFKLSSDLVKDLNVNGAVNLDERTKDWLSRNGAKV